MWFRRWFWCDPEMMLRAILIQIQIAEQKRAIRSDSYVGRTPPRHKPNAPVGRYRKLKVLALGLLVY